MKHLIHSIANLWNKFGPVPVDYGMFAIQRKDKTFWA